MPRFQRTIDASESAADVLPNRHQHFTIKRLLPSDEPELRQLLQQLEPQARFDRFGHDMDDDALAAYARDSLATSETVFGATVEENLIGVAEITHFATDGAAMLAFVVDSAWRRQGIGCRLLLAALGWAGDQGTASVQLQCTRSNWAVRQIAQKANARISLTAGQFLAEFDARTRIALTPAGGAR